MIADLQHGIRRDSLFEIHIALAHKASKYFGNRWCHHMPEFPPTRKYYCIRYTRTLLWVMNLHLVPPTSGNGKFLEFSNFTGLLENAWCFSFSVTWGTFAVASVSVSGCSECWTSRPPNICHTSMDFCQELLWTPWIKVWIIIRQ